MKKRLLALVVMIALLLCGCCTCNTQVEQLQQQVTEPENQSTAITVTEPSKPAPTEPVPTEPAPTEPASDETNYMSRFLDTLLNSDNYVDWLSVAECKEATLDHLLKCGQNCATIANNEAMSREIAKKLVSHPNATGDVVKALCNSKYSLVLSDISNADCNDAESLVAVAKKCARIPYNETRAREIAKKLVSHPNATGDVVKALCNSKHSLVWSDISKADCNDAESLIAVAKKCASITNNEAMAREIAKKLVSHSEFTAEVAMQLTNSEYTNVKKLALQALESLENNK